MLKSFKAAISGLIQTFKTERNLKIHFVIFVFTIVLGLYLQISSMEWLAILVVSGLVIGLEIMNTAIEKLCDFVEPNLNQKIKIIKDASAAAVLVAAAIAFIVGILIFFPYFFTQE